MIKKVKDRRTRDLQNSSSGKKFRYIAGKNQRPPYGEYDGRAKR